MKHIITILWILIFFGVSTTNAYFENKLFCKINDNKITISLKNINWYKKCMDYYGLLNKQISETTKNLEKARKNIIINEEIDYRKWIEKEILNKHNNLIILQNNLDKSILQFEKNLFVKVKVLLNFYLKAENESINLKYTNIKIQINNSKYKWDIKEFEKYTKEFETIQLKKSILEKIFICSDFNELIPMLKIWIDFEKYKKIS